MRWLHLVEKTESHILVGLLLLLLLLFGLLLGSSSTTGGGTTSSRSTTSTTAGDGGELGRTLSNQLCVCQLFGLFRTAKRSTDLLDVLALELGKELLETLLIGIDTNRLKDVLDVGGGRGGVAGKAEEEVGR